MPCGKQYCDGTPPAPPLRMSARLASNTALYSGVNGGVPAGVQFGTPTRSHWPFRSGNFDSSRVRALAEVSSPAVSAIAASKRSSCMTVLPLRGGHLKGAAPLFVIGFFGCRSGGAAVHDHTPPAGGVNW